MSDLKEKEEQTPDKKKDSTPKKRVKTSNKKETTNATQCPRWVFWLLFVIGIFLVAASSYELGVTKGKDESKKEEEPKVQVSGDVNEEIVDGLAKVAGITGTGEYDNYLQQLLVDVNGVVDEEVDNTTKTLLPYFYAANHNMLTTIDGSQNSFCKNGVGFCQALEKGRFASLARLYGVSDENSTLFDTNHTTEDSYLYTYVASPMQDIYTHSNMTAKYDGEDIVITDDLTIKNISNVVTEKKMTYRFKIDEFENYYLYSVESK